jgi:hypothetical protein
MTATIEHVGIPLSHIPVRHSCGHFEARFARWNGDAAAMSTGYLSAGSPCTTCAPQGRPVNTQFLTYADVQKHCANVNIALNPQATLEWKPLFDAVDLDYMARRDIWRPTTEAMYWNQLEVVPPAAMKNGAFLVGEASDHNAEGLAVYACFRQRGDTYECRRMTRPQFRELFAIAPGHEGDLRPYARSEKD